jgi:hypothetical protein
VRFFATRSLRSLDEHRHKGQSADGLKALWNGIDIKTSPPEAGKLGLSLCQCLSIVPDSSGLLSGGGL